MDPLLIGAIAGGGLGLYDSLAKRRQLADQQEYQAALAAAGGPVPGQLEFAPDMLTGVGQGALAGFGQGQQIERFNQANEAQGVWQEYLKSLAQKTRGQEISPEEQNEFRMWQSLQKVR